jgi:glycosyltransferase involved in cell wall biosynthesis
MTILPERLRPGHGPGHGPGHAEPTHAPRRARIAAHDVRPLWTDRVPGLRADHRLGLPLYPAAFGRTVIDADVVVCSSSGFAHGVRTPGRTVVFCYTPARWLYDEAAGYLAAWPAPVRAGVRMARGPLRRWDRRAAQRADVVLTSSSAVQACITRHWGRDAQVLPPPVVIDPAGSATPVPGVEPGFVLVVGRLLAYKHVDRVVPAVGHLAGVRLVVVGDGPERDRIAALAGPQVAMLGEVDDAELRWCYANCAGVVAASHEDYGLTPLEAAAFGRPAAVLRRGGFLDTMVEGRTGVFFDDLDPRTVAGAIEELLARPWDPEVLTGHAVGYSPAAFAAGPRAVVVEVAGGG